MTRSRGSLSASVLLAATAAGTAWIAMSSWRGFAQEPGGFLNPLLLLAVVVAGTGAATRWWRFPAPLVVLVQVAVSAMFASLLITGSPIPLGGAWTELHNELSGAVDTANAFAAPVPASAPPLDSVLILSGLACLLLVDLFACTLRRVPLAGLPLLTIYSIPVSMAGDSISWWVFVLTAAGFLSMLYLQESDQVSRWGRPLGEDRETGDPIAFGAGTHTVRATAGAVGGVATALAVVLPALIPTAGLHVFDFGPGTGGGSDIRVDNPVADLVRDLRQGEDTPLIKVTTTDPNPSYLRILALTRYTDAEWTPGNRDVPVDQVADGPLPAPAGVAAEVGRREIPYDVTVLPAFDSTWLPTQPPISRIDAAGDWRYDDETMDFLAGDDDDLSTSGLHYTMSALQLDLSADDLEDAGTSAGKVSEVFTDLPSDLPQIVRELAVDVTKDADTRFDKAVALQDWFREDGGFTYSLDTASGSGNDALVDFLSDDEGGRTGYCEQFASAMAVMARVLGIPARVGIGFLSPSPAGPNTWVYSARDMHAWPELYFDGAGWVRFEPTPAGRAEDVPGYTVPETPGGIDPSESATVRPNDSASVPNNRPTESGNEAASVDDDTDAGAGFPWLPVAGGLAGAVLVLAGLLLPRLARQRRRERRLAGGPEDVWAELHDTAVDLAVPWPPDRSPRVTRDVLVHYLGAPVDATTDERPAHGPAVAPEGVAALDRLVLDLELLRYSRAGTVANRPTLRSDGEACVAALIGGAPRSARRRAEWWPRSALSFTTRSIRPASHTVEARYGGVVDHVN